MIIWSVNEVGKDGTLRGLSLHWVKFAKVLSVSDCHPARSINAHYVLVKLAYFNDFPLPVLSHLVGYGLV